jgi:hypothetical protein
VDPELECGTYLWMEGDGAEHVAVRTPDEVEVGESVALDPEVEEHLELVAHHPGFARQIEALRGGPRNDADVLRAAHQWRLTTIALRKFLDATDEDIVLNAVDDMVWVEVRPTAYVLEIPRPLTKAKREAVSEWLKAERGWLSVEERKRGRTRAKKSSLSGRLLEGLGWFDRWFDGETITQIWESLPSVHGQAPAEHDVRNALQAVYRRMSEISPEGLPDKGP